MSDPGKDVRGRFGTGSVETDEKGACRWKVAYVKNPNVTPRGDCRTISVLEGLKQKVHSLVDKVYSRKNLKLAWERVRANRGASGTDGVRIEAFEANLEDNLERLHRELRDRTYQPQPVRRLEIPKRGVPGKTRPLGIPSVHDRVCQQAMVNRLEPIFEKVFDPSSFGYRKGRKTADALSKIWREVEAGSEWIVDADLKDYFGSVDHEKLMTLVGKQIADGRVLKLIQQMLKAGYEEKGRRFELHGEPRKAGSSRRC